MNRSQPEAAKILEKTLAFSVYDSIDYNMGTAALDPAMKKARRLFEKSGKSLDQLGQEMGYTGDVARKSAWQFLNRTADPRLSMLRRFAKAVGVDVKELL